MSQKNTWIMANTESLLKIKRLLVECEFLPEYMNFPTREIQKLLNGFEAEVRRLQTINNELRNQIETTKPNEKK